MGKNKTQTVKKHHVGDWPSQKPDGLTDAALINSSVKKMSRFRNGRNFDLVVDGVPYSIRSIPFLFNDESRFRIILNGSSEHVFTWDSQINMLRAINDDSSVLPAGLEEALSEKLQHQLKQ